MSKNIQPITHSEGVACLASIRGRARRIDVLTKSVSRLVTASKIWLTSIVRNVASVYDKFVGRRVVTSVATNGIIKSIATTIVRYRENSERIAEMNQIYLPAVTVPQFNTN